VNGIPELQSIGTNRHRENSYSEWSVQFFLSGLSTLIYRHPEERMNFAERVVLANVQTSNGEMAKVRLLNQFNW